VKDTNPSFCREEEGGLIFERLNLFRRINKKMAGTQFGKATRIGVRLTQFSSPLMKKYISYFKNIFDFLFCNIAISLAYPPLPPPALI
jgi:hypothetical protein